MLKTGKQASRRTMHFALQSLLALFGEKNASMLNPDYYYAPLTLTATPPSLRQTPQSYRSVSAWTARPPWSPCPPPSLPPSLTPSLFPSAATPLSPLSCPPSARTTSPATPSPSTASAPSPPLSASSLDPSLREATSSASARTGRSQKRGLVAELASTPRSACPEVG